MENAAPPELLAQLALMDKDVAPASPEAEQALTTLVDEALDLKEEIALRDAALKATKERFDVLTKELIPNAMRRAGIVDATGHAKVSHRSGASVHLRHDLNAYVLAAEKPNLFDWLRTNGHGDLIREDVHASTLKAFCKEQQENGATLPPMVKTSPVTLAVITVPKAKGATE